MELPQVTTYQKPYPPMTNPARGSDKCCPAAVGGYGSRFWYCTGTAGHEGNHEAGNAKAQKMAEWK